jgi:hypothetical protein
MKMDIITSITNENDPEKEIISAYKTGLSKKTAS